MENKELLRIKRFNKILTQKDTNTGSNNDIDKSKEKIDSRAELERMFSGVHPDNHNDRVEVLNAAIRSEAEAERQFVMYTGTQGRINLEQAIRREVERLNGVPRDTPMIQSMPTERYYYNMQDEQRS
jgi:DNA-binding transcriptional MocR family regulator